MWTLKFEDGRTFNDVTFSFNGNTVKINTYELPDVTGFRTINSGILVGEYLNFNTLYDKGDGYFILSNDGSIKPSPSPVKVVKFVAETGASLEGNVEQYVDDYSELIKPLVVMDKHYTFLKWNPEIPTAGAVTNSITFTARTKHTPTFKILNNEYIVIDENDSNTEFVIELSQDECDSIFELSPIIHVEDESDISNYNYLGSEYVDDNHSLVRISIKTRDEMIDERFNAIEENILFMYEQQALKNEEYELALIEIYEQQSMLLTSN